MSRADESIPVDTLRQAADWFAHLQAGNTGPADVAALLAWRQADPANEQAWLRVERLTGRLANVPERIGVPVLASTGLGRRTLLRNGLSMLAVVGLGSYGYQLAAQRFGWQADLRTGVGEQRSVQLADGTQLRLNTDTCLEVRYNGLQRRLQLLRGEILIETARDPQQKARRFSIATRDGEIVALGTRFTVRLLERSSQVSVLAGAVALYPRHGDDAPVVIAAGREGVLAADAARDSGSAESADAWSRGLLIVNDRTLADVLAELDRYRPGMLRVHPDAANLRMSAVLPVDDIDQALVSIAQALPVRISRFTRYWTQVEPR